MFPHLGGKQTILKFDMKSSPITAAVFINWMVKEFGIRSVETGVANTYIERNVTMAITNVIEKFYDGTDLKKIQIGDWI